MTFPSVPTPHRPSLLQRSAWSRVVGVLTVLAALGLVMAWAVSGATI
jgi:hypothetical protein